MSSFLEIIELTNGDIVLQRSDAGSDEEPLVNIRFSEEARSFLMGSCIDVAKAMIRAGVNTASEMAEDQESQEADVDMEMTENQVLH